MSLRSELLQKIQEVRAICKTRNQLRHYTKAPLDPVAADGLIGINSSPSQIADLRLAAAPMSGPKRRAFEAEMALK